MKRERGRLVWKIDVALWVCGLGVVLAGIVDGLRCGRSPMKMLQGAWAYSASVVFLVAALGAVVLVSRWLASRQNADLLRKYPRRSR